MLWVAYLCSLNTLPLRDPHWVRHYSAKLLRWQWVLQRGPQLVEHLSIQIVLFSCPLGDYGVMVCLYLWACAVALLSPVIVLFRSHIAALQHITQSSISRRVSGASPWLCYTMSSCGSGAVRWETSAPLLLQNPLITWFCLCVAFFTSRQCEKKEPRNTQTLSKWQQRKYNYRKHIHHQPCPEPTVACTACETGWEDEPDEWSLLSEIRPTAEPRTLHHPLFLTLTQVRLRPLGVCKHVLGISRAGKHQHFLIINAEVEAKSCVRQQDWYEFGSELPGRVSGLRVSDPGWPQTCAGRPGAVMKPPSVFWLSQADSCTLRARSTSASSLGMQHRCKVPPSCEGSVTVMFYVMLFNVCFMDYYEKTLYCSCVPFSLWLIW